MNLFSNRFSKFSLPIHFLQQKNNNEITEQKQNLKNNISIKEKYNIISLGCNCCPAAALRAMGLREKALPFDWINSNIKGLEECFKNNFKDFHKNLRINDNKTVVFDKYFFEYVHDYPLNEIDKKIVDNWEDYYPEILAKYERRIQRFLSIMREPIPLLIFTRYHISDVIKLKILIEKYYGRKDIFFLNATPEADYIKPNLKTLEYNTFMRNFNTEANGIWNDTSIWLREAQPYL
jgi:hypothetical protein